MLASLWRYFTICQLWHMYLSPSFSIFNIWMAKHLKKKKTKPDFYQKQHNWIPSPGRRSGCGRAGWGIPTLLLHHYLCTLQSSSSSTTVLTYCSGRVHMGFLVPFACFFVLLRPNLEEIVRWNRMDNGRVKSKHDSRIASYKKPAQTPPC